MIRFTKLDKLKTDADTTLTLSYEERTKSRLRVSLDNGADAGLFLARGIVLKEGDILSSELGETVLIKAAKENVSTVNGNTQKELLLAAYHLGNRHVSLQIGDGWLRYQHDHVLDDMVRQLGLFITNEMAAFAPESGAYQAGGHSHDGAHHDHQH